MEAPPMFLSSPELLHLIHSYQKELVQGSCELCRTPPSFLHRRPQKAAPPVYAAFLRLTAFNPTSPAHSAQSKQSITGLCSEPMAHADQEARSVYCLSHGGGSTDDVFSNYTTVDPKQLVFSKSKLELATSRAGCKAEAATAAQSWETNVKDCKAETDTAVQSGRTHLKKELRSPDSKPFGELFFKCEHYAGHAAQSARS